MIQTLISVGLVSISLVFLIFGTKKTKKQGCGCDSCSCSNKLEQKN